MGVILELKNITKEYPGVNALNNINVKFNTGEIHALMGENGAGKSTLIKTISGAIKTNAGKIIFEGVEYNSMNPIISKKLGIFLKIKNMSINSKFLQFLIEPFSS